MSEKKRPPGVMLYFNEMRPIFNLLFEDESRELLLKIFDYAEFGIEPELEDRLAAVWPMVRKMIDRDIEAYQAKCDQRKKRYKPAGTRRVRQKKSLGN